MSKATSTNRDGAVAGEEPPTQPRLARLPVRAERDEFPVEHDLDGIAASSGTSAVMSHPRRLRTRTSPLTDTRARKPSHFGSNAQPRPHGSGAERHSIGPGNACSVLAAYAAGGSVERSENPQATHVGGCWLL
jgi:hypothetical protein